MKSLGDPIGYENVEFSFGRGISVGGPDDLFPIRGDHGETVEFSIEGNLFWFCAVFSNDMEMKGWPTLMIGWCGKIR